MREEDVQVEVESPEAKDHEVAEKIHPLYIPGEALVGGEMLGKLLSDEGEHPCVVEELVVPAWVQGAEGSRGGPLGNGETLVAPNLD